MGRTKKVGPAARFGARFGATLRKRFADIERAAKAKYRCPVCESKRVVRKAVGIWECRKCGYTFAGGAYTPWTRLGEAARRVARSISRRASA